ncbi:MAG: LPS export ABC transporter permease LptG [Pseudomonadota bacterium]
MIGRTLSLYISLRFVQILVSMLLGLAFLIITVDFVDQLRRAAELKEVSLWQLYSISLLRAPIFVERVFPFACLFAAMMTLTQLNNKMELAVIRSAGVSAWQFLKPILVSAALVGILVAVAYNPLAIAAFKMSSYIQAKIFSEDSNFLSNKKGGYWLKEIDNEGGSVVLNALQTRKLGQYLDSVKLIKISRTGDITMRVDAMHAIHQGANWLLVDATVTDPDGNIRKEDSLAMPTRLSKDDLLGIGAKPEETPFWSLLETAEKVEKAGTNGKPYFVQYHSLTALPLFLVAMVLVAATVCLRFVRFGQTGRMILGGILCGFVLYIVTNLVSALGSNGVIPPAFAAWSPGLVAILFGISVLLHQEDG